MVYRYFEPRRKRSRWPLVLVTVIVGALLVVLMRKASADAVEAIGPAFGSSVFSSTMA